MKTVRPCRDCGKVMEFFGVDPHCRRCRAVWRQSPEFAREQVETFWSLADKNGPIHPVLGTRCWVWTGHRNPARGDYGSFYFPPKMRAHRLAWKLTHGEIQRGHGVFHRCDNPPCVNPEHLFSGTQAKNIADKMAKGRHRGGRFPGELAPHAKLTDSAVRTILTSDLSDHELAIKFGVGRLTIQRVRRRITWVHVKL